MSKINKFNYEKVFKEIYQEDIPDEQLLEEAIVTIENYLPLVPLDELCHRSRPLAIAYLALKYEEEKQ